MKDGRKYLKHPKDAGGRVCPRHDLKTPGVNDYDKAVTDVFMETTGNREPDTCCCVQ